MNFAYTFPAIRGIQAGREYYSAMVPLRLLSKLFSFDSDELPAEHRAQRILNERRAAKIAEYVLSNQFWVLPAITVSIASETEFTSLSGDNGTLSIPLDAQFLINDGQHRVKGLIAAVKQNPGLGDEAINASIFWDGGLQRSQQIFADINLNASKPPKGIGILYDQRSALAEILRGALNQSPQIKALTEFEGNIGKRSRKLFTLQTWHEFAAVLYPAIAADLGLPAVDKLSSAERLKAVKALASTLNALREAIPSWSSDGGANIRRECLSVSGVAVVAIARLLAAHWGDRLEVIESLGSVNWSRTNPNWDGLCVFDGRLTKSSKTVAALSRHLEKQCSD